MVGYIALIIWQCASFALPYVDKTTQEGTFLLVFDERESSLKNIHLLVKKSYLRQID